MRILVISLLSALILGCSSNEEKGKLLAKVNEAELYAYDLSLKYDFTNLNQEDSIAYMQILRDDWINDQIIVQAAVANESINREKIEKKAEDYKNDLIIHELLEQLVIEKLDTLISEAEIKQYYNEHIDEFQLNDYLVKVLYLKVAEDAPEIEKLNSYYKLNKPGDLNEIEAFAKIYATNFYYDAENWIYFDDLLKEVPLQDINKDKFIINKSKLRFQENGYYYFLNVMDYKLKNTSSPLSFERNKIKKRILTQRMKDLREAISNDLINTAYNNDKIEIYN